MERVSADKTKELLAHIKQNEDGDWEIHSLKDHLEGTAELSAEFASIFGLENIAKIIGLTHDYGKASRAFQSRIAGKSGYDPNAHVYGKVDHSTAGAQYLYEKYGDFGYILAYTVAGHHGGIPNGIDETDSNLSKRMKKELEDYKTAILCIKLPESISLSDFKPKRSKGNGLQLAFLIRMLYSCLVDADFLDTESFMSPEQNIKRTGNGISLKDLHTRFDQYVSAFKADTPINKKRADVLRWCRHTAQSDTGLFSLTVPTGGGKTLSSMAFALDHALRNNLRRVIYVIPYTSIIIQNAEIFRKIFGDENVLEHHSNIDPEKETSINRLSSQNWDAPIIVTTNVQFFESFYSNRSSACRKLHNVADSVVILDEAQMLPPEYLKPSLEVINELVNGYNCSTVLCTATQPTLSDTSILDKTAFENVHEIIPDPQVLYNQFNRTDVKLLKKKLTPDEVAERMARYKQILVIVNTRKDARKILEFLCKITTDGNNYHLSTMMCPEHRGIILEKIRNKLDKGESCRVVSTQLIEAGVDLDFPVVYRAVAGLDSIAQAAGRCNRNGKITKGKVFVFKGTSKPPVGYLRQSAESGERTLEKYKDDPLSIEAISEYFRDFYWKQNNGHNLDRQGIMGMLKVGYKQIPFKDMSNTFKIIQDDSRSVIVPYGEIGRQMILDLEKWAEQLKYFSTEKQFLPREMQKRSQRFSVQLRVRVFNELVKSGVVKDVLGDGQYWILENEDIYKEKTGLATETPEYVKAEKLIL